MSKKPTGTARMIIKPVAPFDFELSAKIFSDGDKHIRKYENGQLSQIIRLDRKLVLAIIRSLGTVDEPKLLVTLESNEEIANDDKRKVVDTIKRLLNLGFDLNRFCQEVKHDRVMRHLTQRLRGLKSPTTATVFEALIDSVVEQQISLNVAESMERTLVKAFGGRVNVRGEVYYAFPTPSSLAFAGIEALRKCGLSYRKAEYIRGISRLIVDGELKLEKLRDHKNIRKIMSELDNIRGIGAWTAEMTMVRGMQKPEVFPADDLGLRRVISHFYRKGQKISSKEARRIAEKWGKWKGLAAFYLVVAERLGL
jgi:DNA-3-methyladenine glycosylase II